MEISFIIILIINLMIVKFNYKFFKIVGIYDYPNEKRKIHQVPISLAGGSIILINFIVASLILDNGFMVYDNLLIVIFSILFYLVGYLDDKNNIRPLKKTLLNILLITIFLYISEIHIIDSLKSLYFPNTFYLGSYSLIFTIFCFIAFLNALNMYDGINGQSGVYLLFLFLYLLFLTKNIFFLSLILPTLFFLYLNFKNKCFLGNSGVNFICFVILIFFINTYQANFFKSVDEILILMLLPGIEMMRLFFFRIINLKSPFEADKNHLHHLLLEFLNSKKVVCVTSAFSILPIIFFYFFNFTYLVIVFFLILYFSLLFFLHRKLI